MPNNNLAKLATRGPAAVIVDRSRNAKLGPMPAAYFPRRTCPPSCALLGQCYGEDFRTSPVWQRADAADRSLRQLAQDGAAYSWDAFLGYARELPAGAIWRPHVVGDLPHMAGPGALPGLLDRRRCLAFARAIRHTNPILFTHAAVIPDDLRGLYPHGASPRRMIARRNAATLRAMAERYGIRPNLSANGPAHADALAAAMPGFPIVTILADEPGAPVAMATPAGRPVRACPATIAGSGVQCVSCRLCSSAHADRAAIVGFPAHGGGAAFARATAERNS
jgi:hypothetical protein